MEKGVIIVFFGTFVIAMLLFTFGDVIFPFIKDFYIQFRG